MIIYAKKKRLPWVFLSSASDFQYKSLSFAAPERRKIEATFAPLLLILLRQAVLLNPQFFFNYLNIIIHFLYYTLFYFIFKNFLLIIIILNTYLKYIYFLKGKKISLIQKNIY